MASATGTAVAATSRLMPRITRATSRWIGVASSRKARAPAVSRLANDWVPTRVATYVPLPDTQKLPDSTSSPALFEMRSGSPVSSDSSTSIWPR